MKISRITLAKIYLQSLNKSLLMWLAFATGLFLVLIYVAVTHTPQLTGQTEEHRGQVISIVSSERLGERLQQLTVKLDNGMQVRVPSTDEVYSNGDTVNIILHYNNLEEVRSVTLANASEE